VANKPPCEAWKVHLVNHSHTRTAHEISPSCLHIRWIKPGKVTFFTASPSGAIPGRWRRANTRRGSFLGGRSLDLWYLIQPLQKSGQWPFLLFVLTSMGMTAARPSPGYYSRILRRSNLQDTFTFDRTVILNSCETRRLIGGFKVVNGCPLGCPT